MPPPPAVATQMGRGIRQAQSGPVGNGHHDRDDEDDDQESDGREPRGRGGMPMAVGIMIAAFVLLGSAGVTVFCLTKPPENQRLLQEGQKQLSLGQYAFALKTLGEAVKMKPDDPKALLSLARAYVGVEQVDKAWELITRAQQLGVGVVAEPELASDLANYYRQHGQYQRAIELLRPLAAANINGKKAELADLDASWGDQALQDGDVKQAMRCWEEVRDLKEGSRFTEADSRLATIYQKVGENMLNSKDDDEALKYYAKLNAMAPSAASLQRTAELYEKQGKLELAIDQLRKAVKLTSDPTSINRKLAALMASRGKEMLDKGESDAGYGYLQQAQALDGNIQAPNSTIRNVHLNAEAGGGGVHLSGEVWNPGPEQVNSLTIRGELFDTKNARSLWTRDIRVVDDFVPPLGAKESRPFELQSGALSSDPGSTEFRVYLNGSLYRAYPLDKLAKGINLVNGRQVTIDPSNTPRLRPRLPAAVDPDGMPPVAPDKVTEHDTAPANAPNTAPPPGTSSEEKTLKDLD